jgi:hypothetical protein
MKEEKGKTRFQITVNLTEVDENNPPSNLHAYIFNRSGQLLDSAPVKDAQATVQLPDTLDGQSVELLLAPAPEKGAPAPDAGNLKKLGAYTTPLRFLRQNPRLELTIPAYILPHLCFCQVRGRLIKRVLLPNGTTVEMPVCNARVHICEVDAIPLIIDRLPHEDLLRLRDDLLDKLRVIPKFPIPIPEPDPPPFPIEPGFAARSAQVAGAASFSAAEQKAVIALAGSHSELQLRKHLIDLSPYISIFFCDWVWLHTWLHMDCIRTVETDAMGRFSTWVWYPCGGDRPDIYFWVEQFQNGSWVTVYRPNARCHTYWDYACGTEVVINVPSAVGCHDPGYDIPAGVTLFVLPYAIGGTIIRGNAPVPVSDPLGWLRPDGFTDYADSGLGTVHNAPFARTLTFIHDDSYFIPTSGTPSIKYYRYSYRRVGSSGDWTPIRTGLSRGYRMEYSDRLPTYEAYPVGPFTVGSQSDLFEFKPQTPPARSTDPSTVVAREWTSGNLSEAAAVWDTLTAAPPLSDTNTSDDAGTFEVKLEVFSATGVQVMPGPSTFRFLFMQDDMTNTRLATDPGEIASGAVVFRVHVDNNGVESDLPQPSIDGVGAHPDCGFLMYEPGDQVRLRYRAAHPNDHAVFSFGIKRGSNWLAGASAPPAGSIPNYIEVAAASAPTTGTPYVKQMDSYYQRDFTPFELVGTCVNAAFAASLGVYGKATDGYQRLGINTSELIAFALAIEEGE